MKKLLPVLLSLLLVFSSAAAVYAKNDGNGKDRNSQGKGSVSTTSISSTKSSLEDLRAQLAAVHKDKVKRKELLKQLITLRKENKDTTIPVLVNGKEVGFDIPPVIKSGRTLIPVAAVTKALGASVQWYSETRTVTVTKSVYDATYGQKTVEVKLVLGSNVVSVNGTQITMDVSAQSINGRTVVPVGYIAKILNMDVAWENGVVLIDDKDSTTQAPAPATTPTTSTTPVTTTTGTSTTTTSTTPTTSTTTASTGQ